MQVYSDVFSRIFLNRQAACGQVSCSTSGANVLVAGAFPELAAWLLDRYPMGIAVMLVLLLTGMCAGISYFRNRTDTEQRRII